MKTSRSGCTRALLGTAATLSFAGVALAQEAQNDEPLQAGKLQEVVVTGSHLRGSDVASIVNVQSVDREQLEKSGASQIVDLLKDVPANTGSALYNETGQLTGTAQFELRGLGFSSTLTLLNGRRAGVAPLSDKSGADFVDINQFPLAMVDRVEVLKDGASAIYGSEAVAGVVNLITRKGFEGFELSGNYSSSTNDAYAVNLAAGHRFDRGSINFYATHYGQSGNVRTDFPWLIERLAGDGVAGRSQLLSSNGYPGNYSRTATGAGGATVVAPGAVAVPDPNCEAGGGVFTISDTGVTNRSRCNFDFVDQIGVVPSIRRLQSFIESEYALTDSVTWFAELGASRNVNDIFKQPGSFSNGPISGGQVLVPANHPFNFFIADPASPGRLVYVNPSQWNPAIHQAVAVAGNFRPEGIHYDGDKRQTNTNLRAVNGLELTFGGGWSASATHIYSHAEFEENDPVRFNAPALNSLIASGQYNPFATANVSPDLVSPKDSSRTAANSSDVLGRVFYTSNLVRRTEQQVGDIALSGTAFELPTGPVSLALGGQYRTQSLRYSPDSLASEGLADSPAREAPFSGKQNVWAGYVESVIPLHESVSLQAAVRHEDYGSDTGATTDPKLAVRVKLFENGLSLRGSWGTSFQAPTLTQNETSQAFVIINDPVVLGPNGLRCNTTTSGNNVNIVTAGGNLDPQSSENFNLGFDLRPADGVRLSADYWHYDYSNLIAVRQNGQSIVSGQCVNGVYRDDPRVVRGASGQIFRVDTAYVNVGKVVADGVDLAASWDVRTGFGDIALSADATYVDSFDIYNDGGVVTDAVDSRNFNSNFAPMPSWRGATRLGWSRTRHELTVAANYTGGYRNDQSNNAPVRRFITTDLQYRLNLDGFLGGKSSDISVGARNLFDEEPPTLLRYNAAGQLITGTVSDIDRPGYDALAGANIQGRILYLSFTHAF